MICMASEKDTLRFLETIWFRHGQSIVQEIMKIYNLTQEQKEALDEVLLKPGDWIVKILPPV
jgi:hypothetical protein